MRGYEAAETRGQSINRSAVSGHRKLSRRGQIQLRGGVREWSDRLDGALGVFLGAAHGIFDTAVTRDQIENRREVEWF